VNLRTFLPPEDLPTAAPPEPGSDAPPLPLPGLTAGRPAVLAFLRHTGCPFAEATLRSLRNASEGSSGELLDWIAVSHASARATDRWSDDVGGLGAVRVLLDPERSFYAGWGLGRSSLGHFMGRRSITEAARLATRGIRNRHPDGNRWQRGGTFAVDATGVVRWRHLPSHAGELPDFGAASAAALLTDPHRGPSLVGGIADRSA
jgi:hypothetical protein